MYPVSVVINSGNTPPSLRKRKSDEPLASKYRYCSSSARLVRPRSRRARRPSSHSCWRACDRKRRPGRLSHHSVRTDIPLIQKLYAAEEVVEVGTWNWIETSRLASSAILDLTKSA